MYSPGVSKVAVVSADFGFRKCTRPVPRNLLQLTTSFGASGGRRGSTTMSSVTVARSERGLPTDAFIGGAVPRGGPCSFVDDPSSCTTGGVLPSAGSLGGEIS